MGRAIDDSPRRRFCSRQSPAGAGASRCCFLPGESFRSSDLPIEAYPDVADNYVEIITQWPGISAEQIEQQVTIPLEIVMNGIPQVVHLRSFSLFGLSDLKLIFEDGSDNAWNRERVLERLARSLCRQASSRRWAPTGVRLARSISSRCTAPIPPMTPWS